MDSAWPIKKYGEENAECTTYVSRHNSTAKNQIET